MTNLFSVSDLSTEFDDEPRIRDILIGERLGYEQPRNIRKVIEKNIEKFNQYATRANLARVAERRMMSGWTSQRIGCSFLVEAPKPHSKSGYRTRQSAVFLYPGSGTLAMAGGRRNKARKRTNKPALLLEGFGPPATSGSSKALWWWRSNANQEGADMTQYPKGRSAPVSPKNDLDLYLAFLQREADFVRRMLGYDQRNGLYTPIYGRVNLLYLMGMAACTADVHRRSQVILKKLEVYHD